MPRITFALLACGAVTLAACAPATTLGKTAAPAAVPDATGLWTGTLSNPVAGTYKVTARLTELRDPSAGDLTGTVEAERWAAQPLPVQGNVNTGVLNAEGANFSLTCTGKFTTRTLFEGRCEAITSTNVGLGADLVLVRQGSLSF